MRTHLVRFAGIVAATVLWSSAVSAAPLGNDFTYQGRLKQNNGVVSGNADMIFTLWDAASGGAQVGPTLTFDGVGGNPPPVSVTTGLFAVSLNFGSTAFNGNSRYLNIQVRYPSGAVNYTSLTPRQPLSASPYALFALNSPGSGLWASNGTATHNTADTFVGINRTSPVTGADYFSVRAPVAAGQFGGMYVDTADASGWPFYGYATNGSFIGYHYVDGATNNWYLYNGGTHLTVEGTGDVGIGTQTPSARLEVVAGANEHGIKASTNAAFSYGVYATGSSGGVYGQSGASDGAGVYGRDDTTGATGVEGHTAGNGGAGVAGYGNLGTGVYGQTDSGYAIYGSGVSGGWAGYFNGNAHVNGTLSKLGGSFKIDHPLDPANKYLSHSFVESPDMMNVYNGNIVLDAQGQAVVELPDWFEALNRDFRYQLTTIGGYAPVYVAQEVQGNRFAIAGGTPGLKVSWQVTGIRHDPYADAHRIPVEELKSDSERGKYLRPELYGQPAELQLNAPYSATRTQGGAE